MQAAPSLEPANFGSAAQQMVTVHVRMPDGRWLSPRLACGKRLIPALREFGIPVSRPSASSHRLMSDPLVGSELDALELELTDDSLEPQTYWVAG